MTATPGTEPALSVDSLKQLKDTENEWDRKLKDAREEGERRLAQSREAAETSVREARAKAERDREDAVATARARIATEAAKIQQDGLRAAETIDHEKGRDVRSLRESILDTLLGPFRSD